MHLFVVAFEGQHVVGIRLDDLLGDFGLASHGIGGDDATTQLQNPQQLRHGGNFVALVVDLGWPRTSPLLSAQALTAYLTF